MPQLSGTFAESNEPEVYPPMFSKTLALPLAVLLAAVPMVASAQAPDSDTRTLTTVSYTHLTLPTKRIV